MLTDLYMLHHYFEESSACIYADDLIERYGERAVADALRLGYLEMRCLPCQRGGRGDQGGGVLCRLSACGLARAALMMEGGALANFTETGAGSYAGATLM